MRINEGLEGIKEGIKEEIKEKEIIKMSKLRNAMNETFDWNEKYYTTSNLKIRGVEGKVEGKVGGKVEGRTEDTLCTDCVKKGVCKYTEKYNEFKKMSNALLRCCTKSTEECREMESVFEVRLFCKQFMEGKWGGNKCL